MVPEENVKKLEDIIGYDFVSKRFIHQALTAAGAENENHDGNRKLSQIGASLVDTILALIVYGTNASRGCTARLRINFANKEHYAAIARQTGIAECICYDDREGSRSSVVLRKALNAIIAAVFLDTWNPKLTIGVILRMFTCKDIKNGLLPAPSASTLATNPLSEGVDLLLDQWTCRSHYNFHLEVSHPLFPAFTSPFMEASQMFAGCAAAECVPAGGDWPPLSAAELNFKMGGSIGGFLEFTSPAETTQPIAQQCVALEANVESLQWSEIDHITPDPELPSGNTCPNINMPSSFPDDYDLRGSNRHSANRRKRARATDDDSSLPVKSDFLQNFLFQETQKCISLGIQTPEETYFRRDIQKNLYGLRDKHLETLLNVFVTIASSRSFLAFRDIIRNERTQRSSQSYLLGSEISRKERFHMIQKLDQSATFMQLVKWLHIVELFEECGGPETRSYTGYVVHTPDNFEAQTKMPGNRRNWEETQVALSMMLEVFPEMKSTDEVDKKTLRIFKKLRKLGKRLYTLASKFGKAIFVLMLDCIPNSGSMTISDSIISDLDDLAFDTFVNLLESSQANILHKFGAAILPLLDSITCSTVYPAQVYKLENTDDQDIVSKPKGSDALLYLIN